MTTETGIGVIANSIKIAIALLSAVTRIGRVSFVGQIDAMRKTVEEFRDALDKNDKSLLREKYAEYEVQLGLFERRLFSAIDTKSNELIAEHLLSLVRREGAYYSEDDAIERFGSGKETPELDELRLRHLRWDLDRVIGDLRGISMSLTALMPETSRRNVPSHRKSVTLRKTKR